MAPTRLAGCRCMRAPAASALSKLCGAHRPTWPAAALGSPGARHAWHARNACSAPRPPAARPVPHPLSLPLPPQPPLASNRLYWNTFAAANNSLSPPVPSYMLNSELAGVGGWVAGFAGCAVMVSKLMRCGPPRACAGLALHFCGEQPPCTPAAGAAPPVPPRRHRMPCFHLLPLMTHPTDCTAACAGECVLGGQRIRSARNQLFR